MVTQLNLYYFQSSNLFCLVPQMSIFKAKPWNKTSAVPNAQTRLSAFWKIWSSTLHFRKHFKPVIESSVLLNQNLGSSLEYLILYSLMQQPGLWQSCPHCLQEVADRHIVSLHGSQNIYWFWLSVFIFFKPLCQFIWFQILIHAERQILPADSLIQWILCV